MRFMKKIIASAMAACLCGAVGVAPAFAADLKIDPYQYTISVSAGSGELASGDVFDTITVAPGNQVDLSAYSTGADVILPDAKYYVKGLRLAGHDHGEEPLANPVFVPEGDAQYVVAYGIAKDQVPYTVNYVDAAGNQIAESQTFYGNPGDKPVVAFRYIDGYLPTAYNLTGTLQKGANNEFTFTYNAAPGVVYGEVTTVEGAPAAAGAGAAAGAVPAGAADVAAAAAAGEIIGDDGTPLAAPEELEDIDDEETPLAASPDGFAEQSSFDLAPVLIGAGVVVLLGLVVAVVIVRRKRQTK